MEGGGQLYPAAGAGEGPPVPYADRGRVHDLGARHGGDGRVERGIVKVGDEVEIVGLRPTAKTVVTGVEMFASWLDQARRATISGRCCAAPARGSGARPGYWRRRLDHAAAHALSVRGLHPD